MATEADERLARALQMQELQGEQQLAEDARLAMQEHQLQEDARLAMRMQEREQRLRAQHSVDEQRRVADEAVGQQSAARLHAAETALLAGRLTWFSGVEALISLLLVAFIASTSDRALLLALALTSLLAPAVGVASVRWRDWRIALVGAISTAAVVAVRVGIIPSGTPNMLLAACSVMCAVPSLHALHLSLRWLVLVRCVPPPFQLEPQPMNDHGPAPVSQEKPPPASASH